MGTWRQRGVREKAPVWEQKGLTFTPGFTPHNDLCELGHVMPPFWQTVFSARCGYGLNGLMSPGAQRLCDPRKRLGVPGNEIRTLVAKGSHQKLRYTTGSGEIFAFVPMLKFTLSSFYSYNVLIIMALLLECH